MKKIIQRNRQRNYENNNLEIHSRNFPNQSLSQKTRYLRTNRGENLLIESKTKLEQLNDKKLDYESKNLDRKIKAANRQQHANYAKSFSRAGKALKRTIDSLQ